MEKNSTYVRLESNFVAKTKGGVLVLSLEEAKLLYRELAKIFETQNNIQPQMTVASIPYLTSEEICRL